MFEFIANWDSALKDIQQDLEFSIKGEVKSWVIHLQNYIEKLLKLYYFNRRSSHEKLTLGDLIRDEEFIAQLENDAGFNDISWLRAVNNSANEIKHNARYRDFSSVEMSEWIKKAHRLSMCIYNCTHDVKVKEEYDNDYITRLLEEREKSEESIISYADNLILKKGMNGRRSFL